MNDAWDLCKGKGRFAFGPFGDPVGRNPTGDSEINVTCCWFGYTQVCPPEENLHSAWKASSAHPPLGSSQYLPEIQVTLASVVFITIPGN